MNTGRMYTLEDAKTFGHYHQTDAYEIVFGAMIWNLKTATPKRRHFSRRTLIVLTEETTANYAEESGVNT
jgi:hypothetical protein